MNRSAARRAPVALYAALTVFGVVILAIGLCFLYARHEMQVLEEQLFEAAAATTMASAVAKDLVAVEKKVPFNGLDAKTSPLSTNKDAGPFLNGQLPWRGTAGVGQHATLTLPAGIEAKVASWGQDWISHADDPSMPSLDFNWFEQLAAFDYWDLENTGPIATAIANDPLLEPMAYPQINLKTLQTWAKLRLLAAMVENPPSSKGLVQVQKLASLMLTSETMTSELAALAILHDVAKVAQVLRASGQLPANWDGLGKRDLDQAKRSMVALLSYLDFAVPLEVIKQVFPDDQHRPGTCAALRSRLPDLKLDLALLGSSYPERFASLTTVIDSLLAGHCRLVSVRRYWRSLEEIPRMLQGNLLATKKMLVLSEDGEEAAAAARPPLLNLTFATLTRFPFLRKSYGLILTSVGRPSFLLSYMQPDTPSP